MYFHKHVLAVLPTPYASSPTGQHVNSPDTSKTGSLSPVSRNGSFCSEKDELVLWKLSGTAILTPVWVIESAKSLLNAIHTDLRYWEGASPSIARTASIKNLHRNRKYVLEAARRLGHLTFHQLNDEWCEL